MRDMDRVTAPHVSTHILLRAEYDMIFSHVCQLVTQYPDTLASALLAPRIRLGTPDT